jgi:hypothetical protein
MNKENLFTFILWAFGIVVVLVIIAALFQDQKYIENKHQENFEHYY